MHISLRGEKPKHAVKAFHFPTSTEPMSRPLWILYYNMICSTVFFITTKSIQPLWKNRISWKIRLFSWLFSWWLSCLQKGPFKEDVMISFIKTQWCILQISQMVFNGLLRGSLILSTFLAFSNHLGSMVLFAALSLIQRSRSEAIFLSPIPGNREAVMASGPLGFAQ